MSVWTFFFLWASVVSHGDSSIVLLPESHDVQITDVVPRNWHSSTPPIAACKDGVIAAVLSALGTSMDELRPLLEALGLETETSAAPKREKRSAPLQLKQTDRLSYTESPRRQFCINGNETTTHLGLEGSDTVSSTDQKLCNTIVNSTNRGKLVSRTYYEADNHPIFAQNEETRNQMEHIINSVIGLSSKNVLRHIKELLIHSLGEQENQKNLLTRTSTKNQFAKVHNALPSFSSHVRELQNDDSMEQSDDQSNQGGGDGGLLPKNLLKLIPEQVLLFLSGRTVLGFMHRLFGFNTIVPNDDDIIIGKIFPLYIEFARSQTNVFKEACLQLDTASRVEPVVEFSQCTFINVLLSALGCRAESSVTDAQCLDNQYTNAVTWLPPTCHPEYGPYKNQTVDMTKFVDITLKDLNPSRSNPIPASLPLSIFNEEGFLLLLLFRSTQEATLHVNHRVLCHQELPVRDLIPGWKVVTLINIREGGEQYGLPQRIDSFPLVFISRPREPVGKYGICRVILTVRPTMDMFEWKLDFMTNQKTMNGVPGVLAHQGFLNIVSTVAPSIDQYISHMFDGCPIVEIIVTGHSLGAGVGQVLSLYLAHRFPNAEVSAAFFAAPNAFNEAGADLFGTLVNARIINFDLDPVAQTPCSIENMPSGWPRCGKRYNINVVTGKGIDRYKKSPGVIEIPIDSVIGPDLIHVNKTWGRVDFTPQYGPLSVDIDLRLDFPISAQFGVTHSCGYGCRLSQFCTRDPKQYWNCATCQVFESITLHKNIPFKF